MTRRLTPFLMVAPAQALLIGFIFLPSLYVGWLSFHEASFGLAPHFVGLRNWTTLLGDGFFWRAFFNTFIVVNLIVYGETLLGLGLAVFIAGGVRFPKLLISIILLPYAISEVVAVVIWRYMFEPDVGVVSWLSQYFGLPELQWTSNAVHALGLITAMSIWLHLPFTFLIVYTARLAIPQDVYEAARIDGASEWQTFRYVTVRLLLPALFVAMLFRFIFAFRLFSEVWLLTGGGPSRRTEVLGIYLYRAAFRYDEFGLAAATGWTMVILSFLISLYYLRLIYREMFARAA